MALGTYFCDPGGRFSKLNRFHILSIELNCPIHIHSLRDKAENWLWEVIYSDLGYQELMKIKEGG